jgi:hypothetical protein
MPRLMPKLPSWLLTVLLLLAAMAGYGAGQYIDIAL